MSTYGNYPDLSHVRRILVMKLRHLGDVLLTTPVFGALKRAFPESKIDAYIYQESIPMLEQNPAISQLITYDRAYKKQGLLQQLCHEADLLRRIRRNRYDLVINLTEGDRGALAARFSRAPVRVGVDSRKIYTHTAKNCPSLRHTVERQLDVLRRIGISVLSEDKELYLHVSDAACQKMRQKVPWERFLVVHAPSRWRFKCWPAGRFAELSQKLIERGYRLVFTSGTEPFEIEMVHEIVQNLAPHSALSLAGQISLQELAALIHLSQALVCVDSVPLHMASALKKPVLAIFGPTSEVTWGPWRNPSAIVAAASLSCRPCYMDGCGGSKVAECMKEVSVSRVMKDLEKLL